MEQSIINMHHRAARYYGERSSCNTVNGKKIDYKSEDRATLSAVKLSRLGKRLEAYPCPFCTGWHIGRALTPEEVEQFFDPEFKLETEEFVVDDAVEPVFGIRIGHPVLLVNVHNRALCAGEYCCVHNPSDHYMRDWPMNWRQDIRVMERICPHGVGYPDPDDLAYRIRAGRTSGTYTSRDSGTHAISAGCC